MTDTLYWSMNNNGGEWVESIGVAGERGYQEAGVAWKIIGIKVCYYVIKIFLHNKIRFKINKTEKTF